VLKGGAVQILERIAADYNSYSKGRRKIARYILDHREESAFLSAAELAAKSGTSESAVVRFATHIGFEGYKDMLSSLKDVLRERVRVTARFEHNMESLENDKVKYLQAYRQDLINIQETFQQIREESFEQAVDMILAARRIGLVGIRGAAGSMTIFKVLLNQLFGNAVSLVPGVLDSYDTLKTWTEEDLVIGSSFFLDRSYTDSIMEYAKSKGCRTIVFTDSLASSLARYGDLVLEIKAEGIFISFSAELVVINTLIFLLAERSRDLQKMNLPETEKILNDFLTLTLKTREEA
jgi:DNA-binding MurR/RpiR family transcriptional regulator